MRSCCGFLNKVSGTASSTIEPSAMKITRSVNYVDPMALPVALAELTAYLEQNRISDVNDLVGLAHREQTAPERIPEMIAQDVDSRRLRPGRLAASRSTAGANPGGWSGPMAYTSFTKRNFLAFRANDRPQVRQCTSD